MGGNMKTVFVTALLALGLSGCGFTPIYAERDGNILAGMSSIRMAPVLVPERAGYAFQTAMAERLQNDGSAKYDLDLELKERRTSLAVTRAEDTIRYSYELTAKYTITDRESGETYKNEKTARASYGVVASQYASLVGEEDAVRKAAQDLADQVELDLVLYLKNRAAQ